MGEQMIPYNANTITRPWAHGGMDGQQVLMAELQFRKRMTTAQAVKLIGKTAPSTLLTLARAGRIMIIKRGLYGVMPYGSRYT